MNQSREGLLPIGSFARATRLSLKALRLYDQLGILVPRLVDQWSSYRYYHADQVPQARLIRMMRALQMPLATIRQVLAAPPAEAERLVEGYWQAQEARVEQGRRLVHALKAQLRQEATMTTPVEVRAMEPQPVLSLARAVRVAQLNGYIDGSLTTLFALVEAQGGAVADAPFGLYHGPVNDEEDGPVEVCVPVERALRNEGDAMAKELPGGQFAVTTMTGEQCSFPAILQGYDAVYDWVVQNGFEQDGSPREIWRTPPGPDERIEIALPFKSAA